MKATSVPDSQIKAFYSNDVVKERPIPFITQMVISVLEDRKDLTRMTKGLEIINTSPRSVRFIGEIHPSCKQKDQPVFRFKPKPGSLASHLIDIQCPYGKVGNILWVRETFAEIGDQIKYKADCVDFPKWKDIHWKPSIFMPRSACRLKLLIKSVSVERLHDITEEDAIREGVGHGFQMNAGWPDYTRIINGVCEVTQDTAQLSFFTLWESINGAESLKANPWVWRIEFEKL
jgi:hypothetical protein